jgi:integrase
LMAKKQKRQPGVFSVKGKKGVSYGIDYIHPQTLQRIRKILKNVTTEAKAGEIRAIEIADAARGALNKAYGLKARERAVLFSDQVDAYLKWSADNKKSWKTDGHNAKPLKAAFKGKLMSDMNPFLVEKYKMERARMVNKKTVNNEIALASQVFKKTIEWKKWQGENPFSKARFKVDRGKKPGSLTPDQVDAIISEITHPVKRDMVAFAFYQGWRISEIRKLKWSDVDLDKGRAWIMDPKNGESIEVPLSDEAKDIIASQTRHSEYVFCKLNGDPWRSNLYAVVKNAAEGAGVELPPRKAWHIFRRTFASAFLQNGGDLESLRVQGNW